MAEQAEELDTVPELRCKLGDAIKLMKDAERKQRRKRREEGKIELLRKKIEIKREETKMTRRAELYNILRPEKKMIELRETLDSFELSFLKRIFKKYVLQFKNVMDIPNEMIAIVPTLDTEPDEVVSAILVGVYADRIESIRQKLEQRIETLPPSEQSEISDDLDEIEGFEEAYCNPEPGLFEAMDIFIARVSPYIGGKRKTKKRKTRKRKSVRFHR